MDVRSRALALGRSGLDAQISFVLLRQAADLDPGVAVLGINA